jgi:hypothetical protein
MELVNDSLFAYGVSHPSLFYTGFLIKGWAFFTTTILPEWNSNRIWHNYSIEKFTTLKSSNSRWIKKVEVGEPIT